MNEATLVAVVVGGLETLAGLAMVGMPQAALTALTRFPRSVWAARILLAVGTLWWGVLIQVNVLPWEIFNQAKPVILLGLPVFYVLLLVYLDELLAVRALGGVMVLAANPILTCVRWEESPFRLAFVVVAYLMAVKGMVLVCLPYVFRLSRERLCPTPGAVRAWGLVATAVGLTLLIGGVLAFA